MKGIREVSILYHLVLLLPLLISRSVFGFSASIHINTNKQVSKRQNQLFAIDVSTSDNNRNIGHSSSSCNLEDTIPLSSRRQAFRNGLLVSLGIVGTVLSSIPKDVMADDDETTTTAAAVTSIAPCLKDPSGGVTNCVSTGNVRQIDLYAPPWTFETTPYDAAARIKGVVASDPNLELISTTTTSNNNIYLRIKAIRNGIFSDNIELLVNPTDKVVTFRAEQEGDYSVSDFGAIRKELNSIRQRSNIFGIMGQGMMTADTAPSQNGPGGQLKAFFGFQSGQGFEDVFAEE